MKTGSLYQDMPQQLPQEIAQTLVQSGKLKIERIISKGHHSAPGFWYDQPDNEWVMVVKGEARLRFEQGDRTIHLTEGMYINIAAHEKHRVEWTREDMETIWLAVFY